MEASPTTLGFGIDLSVLTTVDRTQSQGTAPSCPIPRLWPHPHKHTLGCQQASPFSLFAKDLPPITSLHAYAESALNVSFSPDAIRLPGR